MPTKKQIANLTRAVAAQVAEGFSEADEIVMEFVENPDEAEYGEVDEAAVEKLVAGAVRTHQAKQRWWRTPTDCDKLDAAFDALDRRGVVARQHFTCCSTCGHSEIWDEVKTSRKRRKVVGYAFYHMQDTQSAVDGGGIYVKYAAVDNDDAKKKRIGQQVVDALTAAGLKPRWDGDPNCAVFVPVKWRKRRIDCPLKGE